MPKYNHKNKVYEIAQGNTMTLNGPETGNQKQEQNGYIPTCVDIQLRAYQIHEQKGGSALDNWLEAEQCLKNERGSI